VLRPPRGSAATTFSEPPAEPATRRVGDHSDIVLDLPAD
jgi:hypothetical protein